VNRTYSLIAILTYAKVAGVSRKISGIVESLQEMQTDFILIKNNIFDKRKAMQCF